MPPEDALVNRFERSIFGFMTIHNKVLNTEIVVYAANPPNNKRIGQLS